MSILDWFRHKKPGEVEREVEKQPHVQKARRELARVKPWIEELDRLEKIAAGSGGKRSDEH